jgi:hypothetical protein
MTKWKRKAMKTIITKFKLIHYSTLYEEHVMLKLRKITQRWKVAKREATWNELLSIQLKSYKKTCSYA